MLYYETVKPNRFLKIRKGDCKVLYRRVGVRKRKSEGPGSNCTGIARMCNAKACRLLLVDFSPSLGPPGGPREISEITIGNFINFHKFEFPIQISENFPRGNASAKYRWYLGFIDFHK
jgi:hypothetical protein